MRRTLVLTAAIATTFAGAAVAVAAVNGDDDYGYGYGATTTGASTDARVFSASMMRESSPPDAMRLRGRGGSPTLLDSRNSTWSRPVGPNRATVSSVETAISNAVCSNLSAANSYVTRAVSRFAASRRFFVNWSALSNTERSAASSPVLPNLGQPPRRCVQISGKA